jgi:CDP-diacylglycerol--glycerol-3-phosphate 3-phosphatidyltransferase
VTFATTLTLLRLVLVVPIAILTLDQSTWTSALVLFVIAAATDYFDGLVARRFGQVTPFGAWLDASVDKVFVYVLFGVLLWHGSYLGVLVGAAFSRDLAVEILRQRAAAKNYVIPANRWGKAKFVLQCLSIGIALIGPSLSRVLTCAVMANVVLAVAVVASIPGVVVVWHTGRREPTTADFRAEGVARLRLGDRDGLLIESAEASHR